MGLHEILEKFPDHVNYGKRADIIYKGIYVGQIYQDNAECIYEAVLHNGKDNIEFLSNFKYKKLLSTTLWGYRFNLYLLQEMTNE